MKSIRADRPIGFQLRKNRRKASEEEEEVSSQLLLSCNSLDDRIAMLEAQMDEDDSEGDEEDESSEESNIEDEVEEVKEECNTKLIKRRKKEEKKKKDGKKGIDKMAFSEGKSLQKKNMSNLVAEVDVYGGLVKLSSRLEGKRIPYERPTHYPLIG